MEGHKSRYGADIDIDKELIFVGFKDVIGKIEPSQIGDCHNYHLTLVREGLVDLIAHLACILCVYDRRLARKLNTKERDSAEDLQEQMIRIFDSWTKTTMEETPTKGDVDGTENPITVSPDS